MPEEKNQSDNSLRWLALGADGSVFKPTEQMPHLQVQFCENILDAIALVSENNFETVFVRISHIQGRLDQTLEALRKAGPDCRIFLLAEMIEEPLARMLTNGAARTKTADDYLIYPWGLERWIQQYSRKASAEPTDAIEPQLQQRIAQLEKLATEDDLTGLKNRRYVRQFLEQILLYANRENFRVTLLLFDIDNFKHYNDTYGHSLGDIVLQQAGVLMKRCCREHDVVARVGGDEFAVVFWDLPSTEKRRRFATVQERRGADGSHPRQPLFMAERFRREISTSGLQCLGPHGKGSLTISGGLASFPHDGQNTAQLFEQADKAMLEAKRSGKNRIYLVGQPAT